MKKRILIGIYIVLLLVCFELVFNYVYNAIVIYRYNQSDYSTGMEPLMVFNWNEPYVAHYNQGNIYYKNESYVNAIESYKKALELNPPKEKECSIRINLALAMLAAMGEDYAEPDNVEASLEMLRAARDVLLEKDCATEAGDGHSETAEQLKEEIEALIEQLEQQQSEPEAEPEDGKESEGKKKTESTEEQTEEDAFEEDVKKAIQEKQSKANKERQENLEYYEDFDKDYNFDSDGYIW